MPADPLVTILITARNRPNELRRTLAELSRQTYRPVELLVIDDASDSSLEPIVRESWADSRFERNSVNRGLVASRSVGMQIAAGEFVASLDDDSCFTQPDALERAVSRMKAEPEIGILTFLLHNGRVAPADCPAMPERYVASFTGGGSLIRRKVIQQIGGYRDFYFYYGKKANIASGPWMRAGAFYSFPACWCIIGSPLPAAIKAVFLDIACGITCSPPC